MTVAETRNKKQETRNKKQETRNNNDLLSACQGECFRKRNKSCNNDSFKGLQRSWQLQRKCRNYPATIGRSLNGVFLGTDSMYLKDIGKTVANTVLSRYYKGLEGDNSNAVLVMYE